MMLLFATILGAIFGVFLNIVGFPVWTLQYWVAITLFTGVYVVGLLSEKNK